MKRLVPILATVLIPISASRAASLCTEIFSATSAMDVAPMRDDEPIEFTGTEGGLYLYRSKAVWKYVGGYWRSLGSASLRNGQVVSSSGNVLGRIDGETDFRWDPQGRGSPRYSEPFQEQRRFSQRPRAPHAPDLTPLRATNVRLSWRHETRYYPNVRGSWPSKIRRLELPNGEFIDVLLPDGSPHASAVDGIIETLLELPLNRIEVLRTVRLNNRPWSGDAEWDRRNGPTPFQGDTLATVGVDGIDIYPAGIPRFRSLTDAGLSLTRHEFGHLIATSLFGRPTPDASYERLKFADGEAVSAYGNVNLAEDFAEGIEAYLRSNAGRFDPQLRRRLARRFAFFDDVFGSRSPQSASEFRFTGPRTGLEIYVSQVKTGFLTIAPEAGLGLLLDL